MKLAGKVALVTGGNSEIGLATAKLLGQEGAKVVITGRDCTTLNEAASAIGGDAIALQADVANLEQIDQLYRAIAQKLGKIDVFSQMLALAGLHRWQIPLKLFTTKYLQST